MKLPTALLFLYCDTPLHASSGNEIGGIDKPIQRDRTTQLPIVYASSLKGGLRNHIALLAENESNRIRKIFGPEPDEEDTGKIEHAASIMITDVRLLAFPVRSAVGTFAWITSPYTLRRFQRDSEQLGLVGDRIFNFADALVSPERGEAFAIPDGEYSPVFTSQDNGTTEGESVIFLEEFEFTVDDQHSATVKRISKWIAKYALPKTDYKYWKKRIKDSLIILHDDDFQYFTRFCTDVRDRIRIDKGSRTVDGERGALWTEESLPAESILYSLVRMMRLYDSGETSQKERETAQNEALRWLSEEIADRFQLGGNQTLSQGIVMPRWLHALPKREREE